MIYGEGWFGKQIGEWLLNSQVVISTSYIVTRERAEVEEFLGIKRISINDVYSEEDMLVIVAVKEEA